jgi:hypothetical protein
MPEEPKLILVSPTSVNGAPGRILTYPDGTIVVQVWNGSTWVSDKSRIVADKPEAEEPEAHASPAGDKPSTTS